jgi:Lanthionine synthetase C-like protein/HopA1 effector protein family
MTDHSTLLREVLRVVRVTSAASYSWFGRPAFRVSGRHAEKLPADAVAVGMTVALADQLYRDFYTRGHPVPAGVEGPAPPLLGTSSPVHRLLADLPVARRSWQPGWTVRTVAGGRIVVTRGDLSLWVRNVHCIVDGGEPLPGRSAAILLPVVSSTLSPGFVVVNGTRLPSPGRADTLVRIYWNLRWEAAGEFVDHLTTGLDRAGIGHIIKVLTDIADRHRRDPAVLLLSASDFPEAAPVVRSVADRLHRDLRPGTPAFTQEVTRGVGVAECPGSGASFGQVRCAALASAIIETDATGPYGSADARFDTFLSHLRTSGFRPEAPHLNLGSTTDYALPAGVVRESRRRTRPQAHDGPTARSVAASLARRLCDDAIWDGGRCSWVGFTSAGTRGSLRPTFRALGSDLSEGTSGIALFLAEAARKLGDERALHTALGAVRAALARTDTDAADQQIGLYCGSVGIAFAAARIGTICGRPDLVQTARALAATDSGAVRRCAIPNLVGGHAGQVVGLLALAGLLADPELVAMAIPSGEWLLGAARRHTSGAWSWSTSRDGRRRGLTGLAYGAAGVGLALVELYAATRDFRFRDAALRAFAYERLWFSPAHGNWPDLRAPVRGRAVDPDAYRHEWCRGAPGIALSRLRAFAVLGEPILRDEARTGFSTTLGAARQIVDAGPADYSLCHGVSGLADVLLVGAQQAGEAGPEVDQVVGRVARGCAPYLDGRRPWPCGIAGVEVPGLLLGLAGIGYWHLRLDSPGVVPSVQLPHETVLTSAT